MRKTVLRSAAMATALLLAAATATAVTIKGEYGDNVVRATAEISPTALPAKRLAPVSLTTEIHVRDKSGGQPSALKTVVFHGAA